MVRMYLVRHGTALKNLHHIHGGIGTALTISGRNEISELTNVFSDNNESFDRVFYNNK